MATGDAGFAHTDEILANVVESHKLPIRLHIYVSTQTPNLGLSLRTTQASRAWHSPVITRRKVMRRQKGSRALDTTLIW